MELPKITKNDEEDVLTALARESTSSSRNVAQKAKKTFINYGGLMIGGLIIVIMAFVMTTDIKINSFLDLASLGLDWFLLYFCSHAMYICMSDSGMRAGKRVQEYLEAMTRYKELLDKVKESRAMQYAQQFCDEFTRKELKTTRESMLAEVGISYEEYTEKYQKHGAREIKSMKLPKRVEETLIRVNETKPIELTPPMFTKIGKYASARSPLGVDPHKKKVIKYSMRLVLSAIISAFMTTIVADVVLDFSIALLALALVKIIFVVFTGFTGYSFGYENIVTDTVNYVNDQSALLIQLLQYREDKINESNRSNNNSESAEAEHVGGRVESSVAEST